MGLTSASFADGAIIPDKYTQASPAPVSPALAWTNAPAGTQSFALVVDDPDTALQHSTNEVLHWAAFNIPATMTSLPEGVPNEATLPDGTVQPLNTGKKNGFMGPGARGNVYHHYTFQLYALDTKLNSGRGCDSRPDHGGDGRPCAGQGRAGGTFPPPTVKVPLNPAGGSAKNALPPFFVRNRAIMRPWPGSVSLRICNAVRLSRGIGRPSE